MVAGARVPALLAVAAEVQGALAGLPAGDQVAVLVHALVALVRPMPEPDVVLALAHEMAVERLRDGAVSA